MKPVVGMPFDTLEEVEEFYKTYAHQADFAVRVGPQIKVLDRVENKRFYCTRQCFMSKKKSIVPSIQGKQRKPKIQLETRCGCNAHIYVKLGSENKYYITSLVEQHNHGLVSSDKTSFLSSNCSIS
jgi:hypothetical protein